MWQNCSLALYIPSMTSANRTPALGLAGERAYQYTTGTLQLMCQSDLISETGDGALESRHLRLLLLDQSRNAMQIY